MGLNMKYSLNPALNEKCILINRAKEKNIIGAFPKDYIKIINGNLFTSTKGDSTHILKYPSKYERINENEHFFLWLAEQSGFKTSESNAVQLKISGKDIRGRAFITKRFDLDRAVHMFHAAELFESEDKKYELSFLELLNIVKDMPCVFHDVVKNLANQLFYSRLIGNSDLHGENIAFLFDGDNLVVSPVYDIVNTQIYGLETHGAFIVDGIKGKPTISGLLSDIKKVCKVDLDEVIDGFEEILKRVKENLPQIHESGMNIKQVEAIETYINEKIVFFEDELDEITQTKVREFSDSGSIIIGLK